MNLTPKAVAAMEEAAARDGDSKTEVVNRALQVYNLIGRVASVDARGEITILDERGGPIRIVVL